MGRLKFYGALIGIALVFVGLKTCYTTSTAEDKPYEITLDELETQGIGNHTYVRITGAYAPGDFVYEYQKTLGVKGKVDYIIYPLISMSRLMDYYADTTGEMELKSYLIARRETNFKVSEVEDYVIDTGEMVIEGMVQRGFDGVDSKTRDLLKDGTLKLEEDFIYVSEKKPESLGSGLGMAVVGFIILFVVFIGVFKKGDDDNTTEPVNNQMNPGGTFGAQHEIKLPE